MVGGIMTDKDARRLKLWIEKNYGECAAVKLCDKYSVILNSAAIDIDGVNLHTDGIVEKNKKDEFNRTIISGYNYVVLCLYGKNFSNYEGPRIIVYCNTNNPNRIRKYKNAIRGALDNY